MGEEEQGKKKKRVVVESLGWLTESSIMPKKHRAIEGVGPSSMLELKAQLYKSQEESKRLSKEQPPIVVNSSDQHNLELHRAKKKISPHDPYSARNAGVHGRTAKDKLELKAVNDGSASYAALERKVELYDKLVRGELSDEEDKEKYCVDFFHKGLEQEAQPHEDRGTHAPESPAHEDGENDAFVLFNTKPVGPGWAAATKNNSDHKRFVMEVHEEVNQAREKVSELKQLRQEQIAARRDKLKHAYLRKQLEKLKSSPKVEQT